MLGSYIFYYIGLLLLWNMKSANERTIYLYGTTCILLILIRDVELWSILFVGLLHSIIHRIWPFLTKDGYNVKETPFFDVSCHLLMLYICYHILILCPNGLEENAYLKYSTIFWIIISHINVLLSSISVNNETEYAHVIFAWTSLSQAVSTGYWIATMLFYNEYGHPLFLINLYIQVMISCISWVVFRINSKLLGQAMEHNYIEGVFIICTWYPGIVFLINKYM